MRSLSKSVGVILLTLASLLFLVSCSNQINGDKFSRTDLMFADMMIPHHQQAIQMSELAIAISSNSEIISLARRIKTAQAPEIEQMKEWEDSGDPSHMGHEMMEDFDESSTGMMGMLDEGELSELERAKGVEFDRLFLKGMIAHHEGAIDMAQMVVDSENKYSAELGKAIIKAQRAEIVEMQTLLDSLPKN